MRIPHHLFFGDRLRNLQGHHRRCQQSDGLNHPLCRLAVQAGNQGNPAGSASNEYQCQSSAGKEPRHTGVYDGKEAVDNLRGVRFQKEPEKNQTIGVKLQSLKQLNIQ